MTMPASIPISKTTAPTHIINDPIIRLLLKFLFWGCKPGGRAGAHAAVPAFVT